MPFNLSTGELLVLLLVAVLVFGGRLPKVARKVGAAVTDLKRGMRDEMRRMDDDLRPPPPPPDWRPQKDPEPPAEPDETGK